MKGSWRRALCSTASAPSRVLYAGRVDDDAQQPQRRKAAIRGSILGCHQRKRGSTPVPSAPQPLSARLTLPATRGGVCIGAFTNSKQPVSYRTQSPRGR
jgi:hypothetical protein